MIWSGVVVVVGAAVLRLVASGTTRWTFPVLSATPSALVGAGAALLAASAARRWKPAAVAGAAVLVLGAAVLPRAVPDRQPVAAGPSLVVATANLYYGQADPRAVMDLVRAHDVDVLSLQELTPEAAAALDAAGLTELLPHRVFQPDARAAGTGLASRHRFRFRTAFRNRNALPSARRPRSGTETRCRSVDVSRARTGLVRELLVLPGAPVTTPATAPAWIEGTLR